MDAVEALNKQAHQNCLNQLNRANTRIAEFEDIKKAHLTYVDKLKKRVQELEDGLRELLEITEGYCEVCENERYVEEPESFANNYGQMSSSEHCPACSERFHKLLKGEKV